MKRISIIAALFLGIGVVGFGQTAETLKEGTIIEKVVLVNSEATLGTPGGGYYHTRDGEFHFEKALSTNGTGYLTRDGEFHFEKALSSNGNGPPPWAAINKYRIQDNSTGELFETIATDMELMVGTRVDFKVGSQMNQSIIQNIR